MKQTDPIKSMSTAELRAAYKEPASLPIEKLYAIVRFACLREEADREHAEDCARVGDLDALEELGWPSQSTLAIRAELLAKH